MVVCIFLVFVMGNGLIGMVDIKIEVVSKKVILDLFILIYILWLL